MPRDNAGQPEESKSKEGATSTPETEALLAQIAEMQKANEELTKEKSTLSEALESANASGVDSVDFAEAQTCEFFKNKDGRYFKATEPLRRLYRRQGLIPCGRPEGWKPRR